MSGDALAGLRAQLEETFNEEVSERLQDMEAAVLELERESRAEARQAALERLGRDAHSLKGGAQLLGRDALAKIAHALEDQLRSSPDPLAGTLPLQSLLSALDALRLAAVDPSAVDLPLVLEQLEGRTAEAQIAPSGTAEPAEEAAAREATEAFRAFGHSGEGGRRTVRVSTERVDLLLARAGDLIVARNRLRRRWATLGRASEELREAARDLPELSDRAGRVGELVLGAGRDVHDLERLLETIEQDLLGMRVVAMEVLFRQFPRMVRDLAQDAGKELEFEGVGWDTPLDRELLERLRDPVMHLLRNAVVHGIEPPAERERAGKPRSGRIVLSASTRAGGVFVEVWDDGRGIDPERIRQAAARHGLQAREGVPASKLIFEPGFSTAEEVSTVSGRGVGLDAVRAQVSALGGTVEVLSHPGHEAAFILRLPFTLVATRVLLLRVGARRYAVPTSAVERVVVGSMAEGRRLGERLTVDIDGRRIVVVALSDILGGSANGADQERASFVVVLASSSGLAAALVDGVDGEREVIVRGLGALMGGHPLISGAAIVDDELLVPVLDHATVIRRALERSSLPAGQAQEAGSRAATRVLVVDDSITTRTLERNVLEAVGFEVDVAVDGRDALQQIRQRAPDVVVSDIDMPRMDGFELLRAVREDKRLEGLPVILVTSLEQPEQRERGLELGADAYLPKSTFDERELIEQIRQLAP